MGIDIALSIFGGAMIFAAGLAGVMILGSKQEFIIKVLGLLCCAVLYYAGYTIMPGGCDVRG